MMKFILSWYTNKIIYEQIKNKTNEQIKQNKDLFSTPELKIAYPDKVKIRGNFVVSDSNGISPTMCCSQALPDLEGFYKKLNSKQGC